MKYVVPAMIRVSCISALGMLYIMFYAMVYPPDNMFSVVKRIGKAIRTILKELWVVGKSDSRYAAASL